MVIKYDKYLECEYLAHDYVLNIHMQQFEIILPNFSNTTASPAPEEILQVVFLQDRILNVQRKLSKLKKCSEIPEEGNGV